MQLRRAARSLTRPRRRYAWAPTWLRFPLFLFYSFYDNEAYRKLVWTVRRSSLTDAVCGVQPGAAARQARAAGLTLRRPWQFLMMISFLQGYNIPVPGLLPHRQGHGFSMDHLSALFMMDPGALRSCGVRCAVQG